MIKIKNRTLKTILIATGVILFWRGAWGLLDLYVHPGNPLASYIISLVLGIALLKLTHHFTDKLI